MKRLLLIFAVVAALLVGAVAVFLATFDADRFRPQVIAELEKATGQPVTLERLSLGWRGGVALQLKGLKIANRAAPAAAPLLQVDETSAVVGLGPLLRREIQISTIMLQRPQVRVSRGLDGSIQAAGLAVAGSPVAAAQPAAPPRAEAPAAPQVAISTVKITDGQLAWTDALKSPLAELTVRDIDVTLKNIAPGQPIDVEAELALLAERHNFKLSGRLQLPLGAQPAVIHNLRLGLNLDEVRWEEALRALPALQASGLKEAQGLLHLTVERLAFSPEGLAQAGIRVQMQGGRLMLAHMPQPVETVTFETKLTAGLLDVQQISAQVAGGTINITGTVEGLGQPALRSALKIILEQMPLEVFQPRATPQDPYLKARCSLTLEATAQGPADQLLPALSAQGQLRLQEPVLVNMNILREVFQKLSMLPGVMQRIESRLPEEYRQKFAANDTVFKDIDAPVRIYGGAVHLERLPLHTDSYRVDSKGLVTFERGVNLPSMLTIDAPLSDALIRSVNELETLTNAQRELQIPLIVQGQLPNVVPLPDFNYLASRLIQTKVQDFIGDLLQKHLGPEEGEAAPAPEAPAP